MNEDRDNEQNQSQEPSNKAYEEALLNSQMRSVQTLLTVAIIAAPISLLIGGLLLSIAALICAIVALVKIRKVLEIKGPTGIAKSLYNQTLVALVVSAAACVFNGIAFAMAVGAMMEAIQSGNIDQFLSSMYGMSDGSSSSGSTFDGNGSGSGSNKGSVWD